MNIFSKYLLVIGLAFSAFSFDARGQNSMTTAANPDDSIMVICEQMPEFPGGKEEMMKFIKNNMKVPPLAAENGIEGKCVLSFIVGSNGKISEIESIRKVGWEWDEECIRIIKLMPVWKPGTQNGKAVPVKITLPVACTL